MVKLLLKPVKQPNICLIFASYNCVKRDTMKKILTFLFASMLLTAAAYAKQPDTYPVIVSFNSMCCGVPSDSLLMNMIQRFKKQYKIKQVTADKIGPMGREGEYYLAFRLKEFSKAQKIKFIQQLKKTAALMKDKGSAEIRENESVDKAGLSRGTTVSSIKL
jgi:hypothetical protein